MRTKKTHVNTRTRTIKLVIHNLWVVRDLQKQYTPDNGSKQTPEIAVSDQQQCKRQFIYLSLRVVCGHVGLHAVQNPEIIMPITPPPLVNTHSTSSLACRMSLMALVGSEAAPLNYSAQHNFNATCHRNLMSECKRIFFGFLCRINDRKTRVLGADLVTSHLLFISSNIPQKSETEQEELVSSCSFSKTLDCSIIALTLETTL